MGTVDLYYVLSYKHNQLKEYIYRIHTVHTRKSKIETTYYSSKRIVIFRSGNCI